ncbi:RidA family protein [Actinomycetospora lutea]|uniref:RidA family protein n=1 Tax=Actinomycetospora lutea TaxID=663604 RepID=UPI0023669C37|nr:RidA family protein [Actinomycetospora lutea]MDD7937188.1 RidA family protein [Actinomycetospora lutea]
MSVTPEARLEELGLVLPPLRRPAGHYRGWTTAGDVLHLAGQGADGHTGRLGADLGVEQGYAAARACALNLLAQTRDALGSLDRVAQVLVLRGFVACTDDFVDQPAVVDGASDLLAAVFGERGEHARTAIGVRALPKGFAVELDAMLRVR